MCGNGQVKSSQAPRCGYQAAVCACQAAVCACQAAVCACHVAVVGLDHGLLCAACDRLFHIGRKIVIVIKHITLEDFC